MTAALRIKDWSANFEVAQSRRYDSLTWVPFPIKLDGEHYRILAAGGQDGLSAYGVFCALVLLAARMPCRGLLCDVQGAHGVAALCAKTGIGRAEMEAAIKMLSAPEVAWLQGVSERHARRMVRDAIAERARSRRGAHYEAEAETAAEADTDSALLNGAHAIEPASAAAASPGQVRVVLRSLWKRQPDKADTLARLPGATIERVRWLQWRARTENVQRPHGFIEKGIRGAWPVDAGWLTKYRAQLNGSAVDPSPRERSE